MTFTTTLPTEPGLYRHRWDFKGEMREHVLFVGYTNATAPKLQGKEPSVREELRQVNKNEVSDS